MTDSISGERKAQIEPGTSCCDREHKNIQKQSCQKDVAASSKQSKFGIIEIQKE